MNRTSRLANRILILAVGLLILCGGLGAIVLGASAAARSTWRLWGSDADHWLAHNAPLGAAARSGSSLLWLAPVGASAALIVLGIWFIAAHGCGRTRTLVRRTDGDGHPPSQTDDPSSDETALGAGTGAAAGSLGGTPGTLGATPGTVDAARGTLDATWRTTGGARGARGTNPGTPGGTARGTTIVDVAVAQDAIGSALTGRPGVLSVQVEAYRIRRGPALRIGIAARRGASPRALAAEAERVVRAWDDALGVDLPVLIEIGSGIRARLSAPTRVG